MHIAQVPKVPQDTFGKWPTPESSNNLKLCKVLEKFFTLMATIQCNSLHL